MATPIGRILLMPKGDYNASVVYNSLDWVRDGGAAWVCKVDSTTGIAPPALPTTENANWILMSQDGSVGGWSSLGGKPFNSVGDGLDVDTSVDPNGALTIAVDTSLLLGSKLSVNTQNTYSSSNTNPISGQGVADALADYYDKTAIDGQITGLTNSKADRTEIVHFVDATLLSGSLSYNIANALFKTTSRIVQVLTDGGYPYESIDIATDGVCTITFSAALTASLDVSIGISNATGETGTVS